MGVWMHTQSDKCLCVTFNLMNIIVILPSCVHATTRMCPCNRKSVCMQPQRVCACNFECVHSNMEEIIVKTIHEFVAKKVQDENGAHNLVAVEEYLYRGFGDLIDAKLNENRGGLTNEKRGQNEAKWGQTEEKKGTPDEKGGNRETTRDNAAKKKGGKWDDEEDTEKSVDLESPRTWQEMSGSIGDLLDLPLDLAPFDGILQEKIVLQERKLQERTLELNAFVNQTVDRVSVCACLCMSACMCAWVYACTQIGCVWVHISVCVCICSWLRKRRRRLTSS